MSPIVDFFSSLTSKMMNQLNHHLNSLFSSFSSSSSMPSSSMTSDSAMNIDAKRAKLVHPQEETDAYIQSISFNPFHSSHYQIEDIQLRQLLNENYHLQQEQCSMEMELNHYKQKSKEEPNDSLLCKSEKEKTKETDSMMIISQSPSFPSSQIPCSFSSSSNGVTPGLSTSLSIASYDPDNLVSSFISKDIFSLLLSYQLRMENYRRNNRVLRYSDLCSRSIIQNEIDFSILN